jgi:hypothetical protein
MYSSFDDSQLEQVMRENRRRLRVGNRHSGHQDLA